MRFLNAYVYTLWSLGFALMLAAGGLWWLPAKLGQENQVTLWGGAVFLLGAWVLVFNHLPTVGFTGIAKGRWFPLQLMALLVATAGFIYGAIFIA